MLSAFIKQSDPEINISNSFHYSSHIVAMLSVKCSLLNLPEIFFKEMDKSIYKKNTVVVKLC